MEYDLEIDSMHCEQCAANIERYLRRQPGVRAAAVDFQTGRSRLEIDANGDITDLVGAITTMGYEVTSIVQA